ncbi:MAG: DUF2283 domain-containing protein [Candidatus Gracilibacteria bacterium]|nr:DUF2283 domain-containing protein [Candidatus Gracilibacteria bacterium]
MKIINLNSELHIDEVANAAYLYIYKENKNNKISYSSSLLDENNSMINIDFSEKNEIIGIEFIPASKFFK